MKTMLNIQPQFSPIDLIHNYSMTNKKEKMDVKHPDFMRPMQVLSGLSNCTVVINDVNKLKVLLDEATKAKKIDFKYPELEYENSIYMNMSLVQIFESQNNKTGELMESNIDYLKAMGLYREKFTIS